MQCSQTYQTVISMTVVGFVVLSFQDAGEAASEAAGEAAGEAAIYLSDGGCGTATRQH